MKPAPACGAILLALALARMCAPAIASPVYDQSFVVAGGTVYATAISGTTLILGGSFPWVAKRTGPGAVLDATSGAIQASAMVDSGVVFCSVPDGDGGWFIGGTFVSIEGQSNANIAHIHADGSLDPWNPVLDGEVDDLVLHDGVLYAGGDFLHVGGQPRARLAAFDLVTGEPIDFPTADGNVWALALSDDGNTLYLAGSFGSIGGQYRGTLAAVDLATGVPLAWSPNPNGNIFGLAVAGSLVFCSGGFTTVGGQPRGHVAAIDVVTGVPTSWNPSPDGLVVRLTVSDDGNTLYAGGLFATIDGQPRSGLAAFDIASALLTSWDPSPSGGDFTRVSALEVSGTTVYIGGSFHTCAGLAREHLAAIDAGSGLPTGWNPGADNEVWTLSIGPHKVFAGGLQSCCGLKPRNRLAAVDAVTGGILDWNPGADSTVYCLAAAGPTIFAGGEFAGAGGQPRNRVAEIDAVTGLATGWNPGANGAVRSLARAGGVLYAGGDFTVIGGQAREHIAALETAGGLVTAWDVGTDAAVFCLALDGSTLYVGGDFLHCGGASRAHIAGVNAPGGVVTSWSPNADSTVRALALAGGTVYAGGNFTSIGGQPRSRLAGIDPVTGLADGWNPAASAGSRPSVGALFVSGPLVYAGGSFGSIGGEARTNLAALDRVSGLATDWAPNPSSTVRTMVVMGQDVFVGGGFARMSGRFSRALAHFRDEGLVGVGDSDPEPTAIAWPMRVMPNPSSGALRIEWTQPREQEVRVEVTDLAGRRVALVEERTYGVGRHATVWDRTASGARARPGIYFAWVRSGSSHSSRRFVVSY